MCHQLLHSCKKLINRFIHSTPFISPPLAPLTSLSIACYRWKPLFLHYRPFSIHRLPNPVSPVFLQADKYLERLAIVDQHGHYSYSDLLHYSAALSEKITSTCIHGDTNQSLNGRQIAFLCENDMSYVVTQWATWMLGAVAVPLCKTHPIRELCYFVKDSQSSLLVVTEEFSKVGEEVLREVGVPILVIKEQDYKSDYDKSKNYWLTQFQERRKIFDKMLTLNEFRDKPATIIYTSGTTGTPKGVVVSHGNLYGQIEAMILAWGWTSRDVILHVLPLHHIHGIVNVLMTPLHCGATCVLLTKFDPHIIWTKLLNPVGVNGGLRINVFMAVPTIYAKLIEAFDSRRQTNNYMRNFVKTTCKNRIRLMVSGSASLPQPIMERWEEITGHKLLERYGMSEIGMALTNPLNGPRIPGAVGRPMPWVDVCIAKANVYAKYGYNVIAQGNSSYTQITPGMEGEQGELFVRGPNVFKEYFQRPDSTKKAFTEDGWFKTGDTALYENGVYRIMGRTSVDIIKSGGYKISALHIERHLLAHPEIIDCAVVGLPDITWGQRIAAVVVLKNDATKMPLEKLKKWAEDRLPSYQIPTVLKQLKVMPRNAMGKVNKKEILRKFFPEYVQLYKSL